MLVSACLLGERVRYHGGDALTTHPVLNRWVQEGRVVSACPEVAGGLSTPRPAAEIVLTPSGRRVQTNARVDVTDAFERGALAAVAACLEHGIRVAILKDASPSCGSTTIYDGTFTGRRLEGRGMTAQRLVDANVRIFSEQEIDRAAEYLDSLERAAAPSEALD